MAEDEELFAGKELLDLRHFLGSDSGDGIAIFLFGVAFDEDAGGGFETGEDVHEIWLDSEGKYQYYTSVKVVRLLPSREKWPIVAACPHLC